jgi:hypothetical protein
MSLDAILSYNSSNPANTTISLRFILILSTPLRLIVSVRSFPTKTTPAFVISVRATCVVRAILLYLIIPGEEYELKLGL